MMIIYYYENHHPSAHMHLATDDFGNEVFIPKNDAAWYFVGVERVYDFNAYVQQCMNRLEQDQ